MPALSKRKRIALALLAEELRRSGRRDFWVRPIFRRRQRHGEYSQLVEELMLEDLQFFKQYMRMKPATFQVSRTPGPGGGADDLTESATRFRPAYLSCRATGADTPLHWSWRLNGSPEHDLSHNACDEGLQ